MAQRSYDVHRMITRDGNPQGGSIEEFIDRLEQEEATEAPDVENHTFTPGRLSRRWSP